VSTIGTPFTSTAKRALLCGSGELGKEVVIELQRLGVEVIALDSYANAPAMQVADRSHVVNMLDPAALRSAIEAEQPHLIIPEVEAIATDTLAELEQEGFRVVPTARATQLTMNRQGIRDLAAKELGLKTSNYRRVQRSGRSRGHSLCRQAHHE
jgi:phosphoribosylglycinamide formyltransferase 2